MYLQNICSIALLYTLVFISVNIEIVVNSNRLVVVTLRTSCIFRNTVWLFICSLAFMIRADEFAYAADWCEMVSPSLGKDQIKLPWSGKQQCRPKYKQQSFFLNGTYFFIQYHRILSCLDRCPTLVWVEKNCIYHKRRLIQNASNLLGT